MSLGVNRKLNILQQSPHDLQQAKCHSEKDLSDDSQISKWVPSRYNVRASTDDGRLILWNTYRGSMSVFQPEQKRAIVPLLKRKGFEARPEGAVKYLRDRGFLVPEGTNEYRRLQHAFGRQHYRTDTLQLILLSSEDCNFRCEYCYEEFARGTMLPEVRTGIKNLIQKRVERGLQNLSISWFGGEPLYGLPAIEDLGPFLVDLVDEHSLRFHSAMTTNGYLLTPDVAEKLLAWRVNNYQITIDGPPEDHNRSRPTRDGQGSFATIFDNLKALSKRSEDYTVNLRVNFDRQNYPHLDRFFDLVEKEFRDDPRFRLRFRAVGKWGGANDENLDTCGFEDATQIQFDLKREARKRGLNISDSLREIKGVGAQVCYAARPYHFIVGAHGQIMKCTIELDMNDRNVVGHLTEEGGLMLDPDKMALWTEPAFETDTKCQKCVVLPACQGIHCPLIRFNENRSPCTPLRKNFKQEMVETLALTTDTARTIKVGRDGASQQSV